jgi:hypothetical protein
LQYGFKTFFGSAFSVLSEGGYYFFFVSNSQGLSDGLGDFAWAVEKKMCYGGDVGGFADVLAVSKSTIHGFS